MNFQDYLVSDGLKPSYNVIVTPNDCEYYNPVKSDERFKIALGLKIRDKVYHYATRKGFGNCLFTLDSDGNPKGRSCFVLITDQEKAQIEAYLTKKDANYVLNQLEDKEFSAVKYPVFTTAFDKKVIK